VQFEKDRAAHYTNCFVCVQLLPCHTQNAGVSAADIDIVILASSSPDDMFGDATTIAAAIGKHNMLHCSANDTALTLTRVLISLCNTQLAHAMHTTRVHTCTTLTPLHYTVQCTHGQHRMSERHSSL
jgi:hypothetical protein